MSLRLTFESQFSGEHLRCCLISKLFSLKNEVTRVPANHFGIKYVSLVGWSRLSVTPCLTFCSHLLLLFLVMFK